MNNRSQQVRPGARSTAARLLLILTALTLWSATLNAQEIMRFAIVGDYGSGDRNEENVANLIKGWNPAFIVTTGDNNYPDGESATIDNNIGKYYAQFIYPYNGAFGPGSNVNRFFPSIGNHDWDNTVGAPAQPYLDYFALPGNERYYDFVQGPVHFFMLDSDSREPDGILSTSVQANWLRARLAASTAQWKIVILHHPPFSSRTSWTKLQWPYKDWGASIVLAGHAHVYERVIRNGLPYLTNGLGGDSTGSFDTGIDGSLVRFGTDYGAMLVQVSSTSITFKFITRTGTVIDTYTMGPDAVPPNAPSTLAATAILNSQSTLTWSDNALNEDGYLIERATGGGSFVQVGTTIANVTSFAATGLTAGTQYSFRVRGTNNAGTSAYSNTVELGDSAPAAPSNLTASAASSSQINLNWTDNSSNESGFNVERCQGATCTDFVQVAQVAAGASTIPDTGLAPGTTYRYRVQAFNGVGPSAFSNIASATTQTAPAPPDPPSNLQATATSSTAIGLSWTDGSNNENGFNLERCQGATCTNFIQVSQAAAGATSIQDAGLASGVTYRYRVQAFNDAGPSVYSNIASATTQTTPVPPDAPSNLQATTASSSAIRLSWTDNSSNESGFDIERCQGATCTNFAAIAQTAAGVSTIQDTGLTAGVTYRYRVRAFNDVGPSGYSNIAAATTQSVAVPPDPPSNLQATASSSTSIGLSWTDGSSNEDGFKLERCQGAGCTNFAEITRPAANTTTFNDTGLAPQTTYVYRIRAYSGAGNSAYSDTAQATTSPVQQVTISDNFDDNVRDPAIWNLGIFSQSSRNFDPTVSVAETVGHLVITPRVNTNGSRFGGYISTNPLDFTSASAAIEVAQATIGNAATLFTVGSDNNNWYGFRKKGTSVYLERKIAGSTSSTKLRYDPQVHRFWRLRHDPATDSIVYETSLNGTAWTVRLSVARQIAIDSIRVELAAGTTSKESNPGSAHFDNFLFLSN